MSLFQIVHLHYIYIFLSPAQLNTKYTQKPYTITSIDDDDDMGAHMEDKLEAVLMELGILLHFFFGGVSNNFITMLILISPSIATSGPRLPACCPGTRRKYSLQKLKPHMKAYDK